MQYKLSILVVEVRKGIDALGLQVELSVRSEQRSNSLYSPIYAKPSLNIHFSILTISSVCSNEVIDLPLYLLAPHSNNAFSVLRPDSPVFTQL